MDFSQCFLVPLPSFKEESKRRGETRQKAEKSESLPGFGFPKNLNRKYLG